MQGGRCAASPLVACMRLRDGRFASENPTPDALDIETEKYTRQEFWSRLWSFVKEIIRER